MKILSVLVKTPENQKLNFPVVHYFTWKLEFSSNILYMSAYLEWYYM